LTHVPQKRGTIVATASEKYLRLSDDGHGRAVAGPGKITIHIEPHFVGRIIHGQSNVKPFPLSTKHQIVWIDGPFVVGWHGNGDVAESNLQSLSNIKNAEI
jgi:hypothetical protein